MVIMAIVGLPGAGKSEAQSIFEKQGWKNFYCGSIIFDELEKRGLEVNEKNERKVREAIREEYGIAAVETLSLQKVERLAKEGNLTVESFYTWTSYKEYKERFGHDFLVLAIHASTDTRAARLETREHRPLTYDQTISRTESQIEKLEQAGPIAAADYHIVNEGTLEELRKEVEELITDLLQE